MNRCRSLIALAAMALAAAHAGPAESLYKIPLKSIDGEKASLAKYKGKVMLIVNVASECGLTPQYRALEAAHKRYADQGFTVLGFPCNQFGGQEPGSNEEIKAFCSKNYGVTFPMFDKIEVKGPGRHPLYQELTGKDAAFPGDVKWNFGKFLVGRDGAVLKRFSPSAKPDSKDVAEAIEAALAAK